MQRCVCILLLVGLIAAFLVVQASSTTAGVGKDALKLCSDFAFSTEEDFLTQGPVPSDGNPIISDGDLLGRNCSICARNDDLMTVFKVDEDLGLDAVHIVDVENYIVAFSTELDSPTVVQFTSGDLLVTNGAVIPNVALLAKFDIPGADFGLDALQFIGTIEQIMKFLEFASGITRADWLERPGALPAALEQYGIDILFSTEGTAPVVTRPLFLDGDLLSARLGIIVESNGTLLPASVPAGIPIRGVDFGLDAGSLAPVVRENLFHFSTEILFGGEVSFTDGDVLRIGNGVTVTNSDLVACFEPTADFLGLDALFVAIEGIEMTAVMSYVESLSRGSSSRPPKGSKSEKVKIASLDENGPLGFSLEPCRDIAFSTEEDFITQGPEPPDGNPIISDGDLLGRKCAVCARNLDFVQVFDVGIDLGLDAVDVLQVEKGLVAFSTELDSPNVGQFTAGDLLATNGVIIPNLALIYRTGVQYDVGLDGLFFVGPTDGILAFFEDASQFIRDFWLEEPDALAEILTKYKVDLWFSTEGTGPTAGAPSLLDGDLISAATGAIVASNASLLPPEVPAGIPSRGVDFGLDAVTGSRSGGTHMINFSTEILFEGELGFTDGDVLRFGNGIVMPHGDLIECFEPRAKFLGLDALHNGCIPRLEWTWNSTRVEPDYDQVMMAPVAADLNGDEIPDIIFFTFNSSAVSVPRWEEAILRAISGNNGTELFSITNSSYRVNGGGSPAVADIDNDGRPEVLATNLSGEVMCFEHDGTFKWVSSGATVGRCAISVADLDGDGAPEIIAGRTVFNNDGTHRWTGAAGSGSFSAVADLDLTGNPEVITGGTAYRHDGTIYWNTPPSGNAVAVANLDADAYPEIVLVGSDQISVKEHDGAVKWGPIPVPSTGNGPPVVADIDGDGWPEIGVGGYERYTAFETDGSIKWSVPIVDTSSRSASSSAFDFNGDGMAEIIYSDHYFHRIFRGTDGAVLFEVAGPSGTLQEQPIVLDVDNDGYVEIVFAVNNYAIAGNTGIEVYGNDGCWPDARKIWNQHTYHITNIFDDASVPTVERNNWEVFNNFREQVPPQPCDGDFDLDGDVDGTDLAVFKADFGRINCASPPPCEGDFDGDNDVDLDDLTVFAPNFGRTDCPY